MKFKKQILKIPYSQLKYGRKYGVSLNSAKKAFLSGMSKSFKRKVKIKFIK